LKVIENCKRFGRGYKPRPASDIFYRLQIEEQIMSKSYIQDGGQVDYTNKTAAAIASGDVVPVGAMQCGIALLMIAIDAVGAVMLEGIHKLPKAAGVFTAWQKVWWDAAAKAVINAPAAGAYFLGYAAEAELTGAETIKVMLEEFCCDGPRTITPAATGAVTLTVQDFISGYLSLFASNTAAQTVNLPSVALLTPGTQLFVKKTSADAFAVTLDPAGSELIAGGATYALIDAANDQALFVNSGTAWVLMNSTIAA
jgi:predicted RecA/RadA family phage recombinase